MLFYELFLNRDRPPSPFSNLFFAACFVSRPLLLNRLYPENFQQFFWNYSIKIWSDMTSPFIYYMFHSIYICFWYKK